MVERGDRVTVFVTSEPLTRDALTTCDTRFAVFRSVGDDDAAIQEMLDEVFAKDEHV